MPDYNHYKQTPSGEDDERGVDGPGSAGRWGRWGAPGAPESASDPLAPQGGYRPRAGPGEATQPGESDFWTQAVAVLGDRNLATYDPNREWNMVFETGASSPYEPLPGYDLESQQRSLDMQRQAIQQLQQQASGNYETKAQQELRQQFRRQANQQQALAAGQRGMSAGGQALQARTNIAQSNAVGAGMRETLKLQEQQQAQNMLGQIYAAQQAGDVGLASSLADYATKQRGLGDSMTQFYADQGIQNMLSQHSMGQDMVGANLGFDLQDRSNRRQSDARWMETIGTAAEAARRATQNKDEEP